MIEEQTPMATLSFDEAESILYMSLTADAVASPGSVRAHAEAIQRLTGGRKHCVLIDASHNYVRLDDLNDEILKLTYKNRIASAYFNPTLAIRLRVMQIKTASSSKVEVFYSKEEAVAWLQEAMSSYVTTKKI